MIPELAKVYLPLMVALQLSLWPTIPTPSFMAGQIEQETCVSISSSKCWNPRAELKTSREYGFGFGQITTAYSATGTVLFNNFETAQNLDAGLKGWIWSDRYDPVYQMRALVVMVRGIYGRMRQLASSDDDGLRFALSAYNGGEGSLKQDRLKCSMTDGCDPTKWEGHVAITSYKARQPIKGYGQSFFDINRSYVHNIMDVRRQKYLEEMKQ